MNGAAKGTGNIIALESKGDLGKEKALACHQVHNTIPELQNPFVESNQYWAEYNPTKVAERAHHKMVLCTES